MIEVPNISKALTPSNSVVIDLNGTGQERGPAMIGFYVSGTGNLVVEDYFSNETTYPISQNSYIWGEFKYIKETTSNTLSIIGLGKI